MFLAALAALTAAGLAGYQYSKAKHKNKNTTVTTTTTDDKDDDNNVAKNVYNYNYLNDSNTGNTLFNSQQKTKRAIFGGEV